MQTPNLKCFIIILIFLISYSLSKPGTRIILFSNVTQSDTFNNYTKHSAVNISNPVLSDISVVRHLFSNNERSSKKGDNIPNKKDMSKDTMLEEANEKFKQSQTNRELETQTFLGNSRRDYNGEDYSEISMYLTNNDAHITGKGEARNLEASSIERNETEPSSSIKEDNSHPESALSGFYTQCLLHLSFPCIQRKMLVYVDRLNRMKYFGIFGDYLSVLRITETSRRPLMTEENLNAPKMNTGDSIKMLDSLLDYSIKRLLYDHAVSLKIPSWFTVSAVVNQQTSPQGRVIKFRLSPTDIEEGKRISM